MGIYFARMFAGPDFARYYWMILAANAVAVAIVVLFNWNTWRSRDPEQPAIGAARVLKHAP